jgi:protein SCO1/2
MTSSSWIRVVLVASLAALVTLGFLIGRSLQRPAPELTGMTVFDPPTPLPAFRLHDQHGRVFDPESLRGRWSFVFFGYTHCPDICPTTLVVLREVQRLAGGADQGIQYVLVSVDPGRDTAAVLRQYVAYFHPEFIGATGPDTELQRLTRALGAYYSREPAQGGGPAPAPGVALPPPSVESSATAPGVALPPPSLESYEVAHSAAIFLIDPQVRLRALFAGPHDAARVADGFKRLRGG